MRKGQSVTQAATKLTRGELSRRVSKEITPITEDIKKYLAGVIEQTANNDAEAKRILDIFNNTDDPLICEVTESNTKPLAHNGFDVMV